jgi:quercetin dioxygenase-like cupin family protein
MTTSTITDIQQLAATRSEKHVFDWGHLTWFASRAQGNCEEMTIGRCVLNPGHGNPRHYHPNCTEVLVVMRGTIRHTIAGGKEAVLNEGDTVTIPANIRHCAFNLGSTEAELFIAFSSGDRQTIGE